MNCSTIERLLPDFSDGTLAGNRRAEVAAHLAECPGCARMAAIQTETRSLLRGLPVRQTSDGFEARLAARMASVRRPAPRDSWWGRGVMGLRVPPRALRPALALCAAAAAVGIAFHPAPHAVLPHANLPIPENALVSQCVAQHQDDVAAQPLADPAAQNLTDRLGGSATATPADTGVAEENL